MVSPFLCLCLSVSLSVPAASSLCLCSAAFRCLPLSPRVPLPLLLSISLCVWRLNPRGHPKHYGNEQSWGVHGRNVTGSLRIDQASLYSVAGRSPLLLAPSVCLCAGPSLHPTCHAAEGRAARAGVMRRAAARPAMPVL